MMKRFKVLLLGALLGIVLLPLQSQAGARLYVRIGPPRVKTVRVVKPPRPYRHSVWVAGHWKYRNGRHIWVKGYWIKVRPNHIYVQPHWVKTRFGYTFVAGRWTRVR